MSATDRRVSVTFDARALVTAEELATLEPPSERFVVEGSSASALPSELSTPMGPARLKKEHLSDQGGLRACLACGHPELYTQRDFPRWLGLVIVIGAAILAPFTHYISLAVAAALDWILYRLAPTMTVCYVCRAEHRGFRPEPRHPAFDREIEERLLYGTRAVMGKPMREGGTADAPEPEH